jgi:hypothetical protein
LLVPVRPIDRDSTGINAYEGPYRRSNGVFPSGDIVLSGLSRNPENA